MIKTPSPSALFNTPRSARSSSPFLRLRISSQAMNEDRIGPDKNNACWPTHVAILFVRIIQPFANCCSRPGPFTSCGGVVSCGGGGPGESGGLHSVGNEIWGNLKNHAQDLWDVFVSGMKVYAWNCFISVIFSLRENLVDNNHRTD